jgi:hypothetical protein
LPRIKPGANLCCKKYLFKKMSLWKEGKGGREDARMGMGQGEDK